MAARWDSMPAMQQWSRTMTMSAVVGLVLGVASWPFTLAVAIPALILGTVAVLCALFAWFRLDHLRELDRLRR